MLLVGGATGAQGEVKMDALKTLNSFAFAAGHAPSIATTQVTWCLDELSAIEQYVGRRRKR